MTTIVTLHAGHDVRYLTAGQHCGGCSGAMAYYTAGGEPPGQWAGAAAARLGLTGEVDPEEFELLYGRNISPDGELLVKPRQAKDAEAREQAAVDAYVAKHPYASPVEVAEVRAAARGSDPKARGYFDLTVSAVKSVSVLHASYRVKARQARERGDQDQAAELDRKANTIEKALMDSARDGLAWLERHATYTRTGHHSSQTGEWRDGDGLTAGLFLHHISRDGDPHLHVHVAIWNRVQRRDSADQKWRTLDSRTLHNQRLAVAGVVDKAMETRLTAMGHVMVLRADGNGAEVGGVSQDTMDLFSSRTVAVTDELRKLADQYQKVHGEPPNRRTLWQLHQQAGQNTRRSKAEARRTIAGQTGTAEPTPEQRFAAWEAQTTQREVSTLSAVDEEEAGYAAQHSDRARPVLDDAAKRRIARIALAEVQSHHATWSMAHLRFEVHRALPVLPATADPDCLITEIARLSVSGRAGAEVVQVTAPDVTDVTSLGVRKSDGGSIYRPPHDERYCTLAHLDVEEQILTTATRQVPQLVSDEQARAAVTGTDLNPQQAAAVVTMLTATTATTVLIAPAGAGKSHTMAEFAVLWQALTGKRVIGLATSTNAARVLASEGLTESYNIAEFLGKTEGSEKLRRPVPLHAGDVLVIDEATMAATGDLAMLTEAARVAGARIAMVGDTQQLGSPETGGMFRLLAKEVPSAALTEVRRFTSPWEADASVRLRAGDFGAVAVYDQHGRIRGADHETVCERAATAWLADHLRGKEVLLLAGSNEDAADLARRVQAKLIQAGKVSTSNGYQAQVPLADGNQAHPGDLIRARLNTRIDAGGQRLANRDTLKITAIRGPSAEVRRQQMDGTWTDRFWVPRSYLTDHAELAYAGNVHVAQGRTVDTAHLLVTETLSRQSLYVGLTRGRETNTAHVVTGSTAPPGHQPYEQATPEAVLHSVIANDSEELSATEYIRQSQEWASGTGHLLNLWSAAIRHHTRTAIDQQITARLSEADTYRYQHEHARKALHAQLQAAQLNGHNLTHVIGRITAAPLDGARSISSVLHARLANLHLPQNPGHDLTWAQRTPSSAPEVARQLAEAMDARQRELGERTSADPQPWLTGFLGTLTADASPALRADYTWRAAVAAAYREIAGITNPTQAISPEPHLDRPDLEHMRQNAIRALQIHDETAMLRGLSRGQLEALHHAAERAHATAPPDVSERLKLTAQAEADALQQAADAQIRNNPAETEGASALAEQLATHRHQLETEHAKYETWATQTRAARDTGGKARIELERRGYNPHTGQASQPQTSMAEWWRELDADFEAADAAIAREHQAAINTGQAWPPEPPADSQPARTAVDEQAARLDELLFGIKQSAAHRAAENAQHQANSEYAARIQPEAQAEHEAALQAEGPDEADIEL